jgi:hypothetical protein
MTGGGTKRELAPRKALCQRFSGPKSQLGKGLRPFMAWVYHHYRHAMPQVTVCYAKRDTQDLLYEPDPQIEGEFRLDLDRHLPYDVQRPEGSEVRDLPAESLLVKSFRGDPGDFMSDLVQWLADVGRTQTLAPGYRERYVKIGSAESPDWELEAQVVFKR